MILRSSFIVRLVSNFILINQKSLLKNSELKIDATRRNRCTEQFLSKSESEQKLTRPTIKSIRVSRTQTNRIQIRNEFNEISWKQPNTFKLNVGLGFFYSYDEQLLQAKINLNNFDVIKWLLFLFFSLFFHEYFPSLLKTKISRFLFVFEHKT